MITKDTNFLIVGLGLIGGSYAKALKNAGYSVSALDINEESIQYALENKIIDKGDISEKRLIQEADFIFICLYPTLLKSWIEENQQYFKSGITISDVCGVKGKIVDVTQEILRKDVEFIASHPMAGKEVSGVKYADPTIFEKANFIITPTDKNTLERIEMMKELAKILGFTNISVLSVQKHDEMIGFVSQLTHVIAVTLMNTNDNTHLVDYTGDSFRDLTRIAKINENLWSELFISNKENLVKEIQDFQRELEYFERILQNENVEEMKRLFIQSTERRKLFDKRK